jgi:hypothetical protein
MEAKSCMSDVTEIPSRSRNHAQRSSQSEWQVHIWRCRYRGGTISPDAIKSDRVGISQLVPKTQSRFSFDPIQSRNRDCFQQRRPQPD